MPTSLAVCFVNSKGQVPDFKKEKKWSSTIHLGADSLAFKWSLIKGTPQAGGRVAFRDSDNV